MQGIFDRSLGGLILLFAISMENTGQLTYLAYVKAILEVKQTDQL